MQIPVLGKEYYFFDDGKISLSRCYKAKVTGIYPYKEKINVKVFDYDLDEYKNERGLYFPFEDYTYGEIVVKSEELANIIKRENYQDEKRDKFKEKFLSDCNGDSTILICDNVFKREAN